MNLKIKFLIIIITLSILFINGCIEEEKINDKYDIYVGSNIDNGYSTIQKAINNASNQDSIYVYNGIYNETIKINKSINLITENNDKTIIDYKGNKTEEIAIITITSDNCTINGIRINNLNKNIKLTGILIKSSNNTIINNTITNTDKGIFIESDYNTNYFNNTILFNNLINNSYGLHIIYSPNNNISDNNIKFSKEYGIYLLSSDTNTLSNNTFSENNYGLRIKGSRGNKLFNNNIILNQKGLYFCCGARNNIVYNNNFQENNIWHANDALGNQWDNGIIGNYWDDYEKKYPNSEIINGIWETPYNITGGSYTDNFPLINPI